MHSNLSNNKNEGIDHNAHITDLILQRDVLKTNLIFMNPLVNPSSVFFFY